MSLLIWADEWVIEKLTKFSHWFQKQTGLTNFFFVRMGVVLAVLYITVEIINYFKPFLGHKTDYFSVLVNGLLLYQLIKVTSMSNRLEEILSFSDQKTLSPFRTPLFTICRMFNLLFLCFFNIPGFVARALVDTKWWFLEAISHVGLGFGFQIVLFFLAVDPLPPGKSKVREWLEKLIPAPQPELAKVPTKR